MGGLGAILGLAVAVFGIRLSRRLGVLQAQLDRELTPALADLARAVSSALALVLALRRGLGFLRR